jgi:FKBP-type peptidyl-prolyl cis-trans isomerase SlyD
MNIIKDRVVSIDYTLTDMGNNTLDSTEGTDSLFYLHGHENIIPGLEKALEGKSQGDSFKVTIPSTEAYGDRDARLIVTIPLDRFQGVGSVKPGMQFHAETPDGGFRMVTVTQVEDNQVTIDGNHPLAGLDLNFDVTVVDVREANAEEMEHGHVHSHGPHHGHCDDCGGCRGCS